MKKKQCLHSFKLLCYPFLRKMKLTILLLLVTTFSVLATESYSQSTKLTIVQHNTTIEDVLKTVEQQSEFRFFYNGKINVEKKVNINIRQKNVHELLDRIFQNTDIGYEVIGRQIALFPKTATPSSFAQQQKKTTIIKGKITGENNEILPGVSVVIKGTTTGTISDLNGDYSIEIPTNTRNTVLIFSYVGYLSQKIQTEGRNDINVSLTPDTKKLEEIVVVGYGTQARATLTGSVANINAKEITTSTSANVVNLLAGKLPGLRVAQRTGEPGDYATDFDIRGFGAPLIIVDGIPRTNFNHLDPNEIESISILKDASAAIYGVKGANGVVLVTTKRGGGGKTEFNYSATFGVSTPANTPQTLNAYQYATLTDESYINNGATPPYSKDVLQQYQNGTLPSTNWYNLVTRKYAPEQQHSLSARGSSDKVSYFLSAGYYNEGGIYKTGDINANRYNFRSNITANLTNDLQAEVLINGIQDTKNSPAESTGGIFQELWSQIPTLTPYANNNPAYLQNMADAAHPLSITNSSICGYNDNTTKTFNGSIALNYKIHAIEGLKARALFAYDDTYSLNKKFTKEVDLYSYDPATQLYSVTGSRNAPTSLGEYYSDYTSTTTQLSLDYAKTFNSVHNVKGLLLFEKAKQTGTAFQGSKQFSLDAVDELYAGNDLNQLTTSTAIIPNVNESFVGRINYDYNKKYLVEGSFRYEGSSKFAVGHKWGFFPAISGGWRISEEPFLKNQFNFLDNLKLRASYGKVGDDGSSTYQYLSGYNYPGSNFVFNNTLVNGLGFRGLANPNLTWYTSNIANIGLDADLWNGLLNAQIDYFSRKRDGLLATRVLSLPGTVGAGLPQENLNSDLTRGFELVISHHNKIGEVGYNVTGNISFTRTKNNYIERASDGNSYNNWRNNNSNRWNDLYFGYKVIGRFTSFEQIKNSPVVDGNGNRSVLPGDFIYEDFNHDGIINDNDMHNVGRNSNTPEINFGLNLGAQWKGFDVNALLQGGSNFTVSYLGTIALQSPLAWGRNGLVQFMDRWHTADLFDPNSAWIPGKYPSTRVKGGTSSSDWWNYLPSDFWLQNATYLRLKSVEIGYTIPAKVFGSQNYIKSLRVYVNGYNLVTWSGLNNLIDPEHTNTTYGNIYPITKNFNFGVDITF